MGQEGREMEEQPAHLHYNTRLLLTDPDDGPCHLVSSTIEDYIL